MSLELKNIKKQKRLTPNQSSSIVDRITTALDTDISFGGNRLSDKQKERFYDQLQLLLDAGLDIKSCFELIAEQNSKKGKEVFESLMNQIIAGKSLSQAIKERKEFTDYEYYSLQIGEQSGRIKEVLRDLSLYYKRKVEQRRSVISALSYPLIVICFAAAAVVFMLRVIVPMFEDVFKRFNGDLPTITKTIINLSDWIAANGLFILLFLIAIIFAAWTQREKLWFRKASSFVVLKLPVVGPLVKQIYLARFAHSMSLLIGAKNPLLSSLSLVKKMIGFYPLQTAMDQIEDDVLHGTPLNVSMKKFPVFDDQMIALMKVAEETNQLELIFNRLNNQFTQEVEYRTGILGDMMEPFLIIFVGGFVAVILIAMYLPLFQLSTSVF